MSLRHEGRKGHHFVTYDALVADPAGETNRLFGELELASDVDVLARYREVSKGIIRPDEAHKRNTGGAIRPYSQFEEFFDAERREDVRNRLEPDLYRRFCALAEGGGRSRA